jgi:hypothetical protein
MGSGSAVIALARRIAWSAVRGSRVDRKAPLAVGVRVIVFSST